VEFIQQNDLKVGVDNEMKILDKYTEIAQERPGIASWLQLMSFEPSIFEAITSVSEDVSIDTVDFYLNVCKGVVNQHKLIIHSLQTLSGHEFVDEGSVNFAGENIQIFDRDSAIGELVQGNNNITTKIINSVVATVGGRIRNARL
jgi:hypothetical protein